MTQYTQPVVGQQQQTSPPQQQQQQQQNTTIQTTNNNNMNNSPAAPTTPATNTTSNNNNQTQAIAVQPQAPSNNNNSNTYTPQPNSVPGAAGGVGPVYNPQLHATNMYVPAHTGMSGPHHPHHQPGAMYSTMIPAPLSSNVFVNNVTANVNLHGWSHTAVPQGGWVHHGGAPQFIHGEISPDQGAAMQPMGAMPVGYHPTGPLLPAHAGGGRDSRRGPGRGGGSGSRKNDYNMQRHKRQQHHHQQQHEGSPAPQTGGGQPSNQQSQEQQTLESQMISNMPYAAHAQPQYAALHGPQYQYPYPYFAPHQPMIHAGQSPAAQQAAGPPIYFSPMPVYNGPPIYNYGYIIPPVSNPTEYQYIPAEEVMAGSVDERQTGVEQSGMMWHQQPMYPDEYTVNPNDIHTVGSDDMNHNAGSATDTPTSMLSPNYTPIYDPQMHEMQQQMGVMQIYDDPQMGQIQVMHAQGTGLPTQIEDDISECESQQSVPIQMVPAGAIITTGISLQSTQQGGADQIHQQQSHLIVASSNANTIMAIEQSTSTTQLQQQISGDNSAVIDGNQQQSNEFVVASANMQTCESVTSLNDENVQQCNETVAQDYQQQPQPSQQVTATLMVDGSSTVIPHMEQYNNANTTTNNKILMTDVHELQENVAAPVVNATASTTTTTNIDVAIEATMHHQTEVPPQQQPQLNYPQDKQKQPQNYKQQQYHQHQQLQTQPSQPHHQSPQNPQQQQQPKHQQQPQPSHYHNYDNRKSSSSSSSSQMYGNQPQSRRKHDYHTNQGSINDASTASSSQTHQGQQPTTKTMSWTNSSQHKKSTNTVAVTATPSSTHGGGGNYNKQTNSSSTSTHGTRTYTNQQHQHSYQQQQQTSTQTRNYGAMKMPSSPVSSGSNTGSTTSVGGGGSSTMERKISQSSESGKVHTQQTTSTASTTAAPHQFQQITASQGNTNEAKQYPQSGSSRKQSTGQQSQTGSTTSLNAAEIKTTPPINLAPPATATTQTAPSTPSWASLFTSTAPASVAVSSTSGTGASQNRNTSNSNTSNIVNTGSSSSSTANYSQKPIAKVAPFESASSSTVTPVAAAAVTAAVTPGALSYSAASAQNLSAPSTVSATSNSATATAPVAGTVNKKITTLANLDEFSLKFADFLTKYKSDWANISLRPRGLTNRSNYCYINSILQALLGCSPLYNLMRSIPKQAATLCEVKTPTINAMMSFMCNFSNLPSGLRLRSAKGGKGNKDDLTAELQCDPAFEPTEIYKLWNDSREEHVEGRQEDAEEFLSYILNKLNDEMLEVIKLIAKPKAEQNGQNEQDGEDGDVWQMICNNRNKGSVTRQTDFGCTPLSDIFRGELRSRLQREGEHPTDVIQPFLTLPLNIEKAASVKEALEILVGRDQLEGVTGSKSKQEVLAWQQMNVEKLPPILILHLKWFDYRSDGCTKILKKVEFPVDLKIDAKILASKKYSQKQRAYRLFAVVYHDGKEASKGHYITDVYHTGYGSWLRYDDSSVKSVSENHVLLPRTPRVPYLLYYRRCDTIPQQSNNSGGNNSATSGNNASGGGGGNNSSK
ncbi:ubiquitin specific protease 10 [Haematobia irritans]|uniref:ubiquitin specific protease 10 n=1 Tax=Haematobia irritans TaxID=7368 RepID=UPI003F50755E